MSLYSALVQRSGKGQVQMDKKLGQGCAVSVGVAFCNELEID